MNTRIYGAQKFTNLVIYSLGGHSDQIVGAYFMPDSLDVSFTYFSPCYMPLVMIIV